MRAVMDITDARNVIKELKEKPFICSQYTIETESGYVITTKSKRPYCNSKKHTNADRIRSMSDEELACFIRELNERCLAGAGMVDCSNNTDCIDCKGVVLEWLQSEVEE